MTKRLLTATAALAMLTSAVIPAHATTVISSGDLFFTTFQNQGGNPASNTFTTNVWKVSFVYDSVSKLTLGTPVAIKALSGADGLMFDPNDPTKHTLLIGEQSANKVAQMSTDGSTLNEKRADGSKPPGFGNGQAYGVVSPDNAHLIVLPNDAAPVPSNINVSTLGPALGDGVGHTVSGVANPIRGMDMRQGVAYWGDADDRGLGQFGTISLSTFVTSLVTVVDDTAGGTAHQGQLPSHGVTYDLFTDCFMLSSGNAIWQVCHRNDGTFHIVAKVTTPDACGHSANQYCAYNNWDQTSVDGQGHMFAANNDGDLFFVDYQASGNIGSAGNYTKQQFLAEALDDIVNGGGAPPPPLLADGRMTGGGSVFTANGIRVTHGFEIHCDVQDVPNSLEINWDKGNNFHLETLTSAFCFTDPKIDSGHPKAPFNTYVGTGTGKLNGVLGATASWTFTDAGEPGSNDSATIVIKDAGNNVVLTVTGNLTKGNQQAHTDNK